MSEDLSVPIEGWPDESAQRLAKARLLEARGIAPFPVRFERSHSLAEVVAEHGKKSLEELEAQGAQVRVAGRVMTLRIMGKASFATLSDGSAALQLYVRVNDVGPEGYRLLDLVDRGDYLGVAGRVMRTRKGELSVQATELFFLSKALLPPPEKWHGLSDTEQRYRRRYVDLMVNPEVRRTFVARSAMVAEIRRFLDTRGYVEVETPMMQPIAGGALARPFTTHHNALGIDLYLRIAPELYLKRLVVGGLERVYEINRNFRNEGISSMHNPEFTMLEFYTACFDCRDVMALTELLVEAAARRVSGGNEVVYRGRSTSFRLPFRRVAMVEAVAAAFADQPALGLDLETLGDADRLAAVTASPAFLEACQRHDVDWAGDPPSSHGKRVARLFEEFVEASLWEPTFVVDYPLEISPLSKARPDAPGVADRFELYLAGMEVANGFSELNDPLEQRRRFEEQIAARARGDVEAHLMDDDYVRALGYGLPPTGGCGVGIDRLAMVLTDSPSIRDVILFPQLRPETGRARSAEEA
jgi:lysyl-tRNA synthetase, class II